jgi:hypothetical protein
VILLAAVGTGLMAGILRARLALRSYQPFGLRAVWLVLLAFIPQYLAFNLPGAVLHLDRLPAAILLVSTQAALLVFAWLNRKSPGFWLLGLGLALNFCVIVLNGGLMPVSPETVQKVAPLAAPGAWQLGERLGTGKDIVLLQEQTRLVLLSDCLTLPDWMPLRVAFSLGDVVMAAGCVWLFWAMGGQHHIQQEQTQ